LVVDAGVELGSGVPPLVVDAGVDLGSGVPFVVDPGVDLGSGVPGVPGDVSVGEVVDSSVVVRKLYKNN